MHRGAEGLPALERDRHHEPPLVTVPLPLPAVVGAAVALGRLSLLAVALGLAEVVELLSALLDEEELRAVLDALEDVPAYEAAAT